MIKMLQSRRNVDAAGAGRGGPDEPAVERARRLRQVPLARHLPHPRRVGDGGGDRRAHPAGRATATVPDSNAPKYLNSPATPLFDKSRTLYLIERARNEMRKARRGGPRRGLHRRADGPPGGLRERRGRLGTALTPAQVAVIARYTTGVVLAYDVDPAGQHAGSIGGAELFHLIGPLAAEETGVEITRVQVARLPDGKDPDEVIRDSPICGARRSAPPSRSWSS